MLLYLRQLLISVLSFELLQLNISAVIIIISFRTCVCACVRACVRVRVRVCMCARALLQAGVLITCPPWA